jgi:hypothetical protein
MLDLAPIAQALAHVPPDVQKSLWKTVASLVGKVAEWPAALIDGKIQVAKAEAAGSVRIIEALSMAAATRAGNDPELVERAIDHFTSKLLRGQENREAVVRGALDELKNDPPTASNGVIDDDWLDIFSRYAERRSDPEMRAYLGRVLAGEIRRPKSFSPATIEVLAKLSTETAALFLRFCNVSLEIELDEGRMVFLIAAPFDGIAMSPGHNSLEAIGLAYPDLCELQDAGLVQHDLDASHELPREFFATVARIGARVITPAGDLERPQETLQINTINYTRAGREIRAIVDLGVDEVYLAKYAEWLKRQVGLTLSSP